MSFSKLIEHWRTSLAGLKPVRRDGYDRYFDDRGRVRGRSALLVLLPVVNILVMVFFAIIIASRLLGITTPLDSLILPVFVMLILSFTLHNLLMR